MAANHNHQHQFGTGCGHSHGPAAVDDHHRGDGEFDDFNDLLQESHPCCAKDAASKARALKVRSALDKADRTQIAVKARREAVSLSGAIPDSMLPECQGEDYPALKTARRAAMKESRAGDPPGNGRCRQSDDEDEDEDDDDEDDGDLDYLLDDPELLRMDRVRVEGMQADAARLAQLRELGFGVHIEVPESVMETTLQGQFRGAGVVAHLYDPDSKLGASLDLLLEAKARSQLGTRFVRSRVRPGSAVASRMRVKRVPALACYQGGVRVAYTDEMSQFGNSDEGVDPGAVDRWLVASGTLEFESPSPNVLQDIASGGDNLRNGHVNHDDDDSDASDGGDGTGRRFNCGLNGCHKPFEHSHFLADGGGGLPRGFEKRL